MIVLRRIGCWFRMGHDLIEREDGGYVCADCGKTMEDADA